MALAATIINQIRDEVGAETKTGIDDDAVIEVIYNDVNRGNLSVLVTSLIVWKNRKGEFQARSFDVTVEGAYMLRNQRLKMFDREIARLEDLVDDTAKGKNEHVQSTIEQEEAVAEFSA